jgi:hypothetical protein
MNVESQIWHQFYDAALLHTRAVCSSDKYRNFEITRRLLDLSRTLYDMAPVTYHYVQNIVSPKALTLLFRSFPIANNGATTIEEQLYHNFVDMLIKEKMIFAADMFNYELSRSGKSYLLVSAMSRGKEVRIKSEFDLPNSYVTLQIYSKCHAIKEIYETFIPDQKAYTLRVTPVL